MQEYDLDTGDPDGEIAAWGLAYDDGSAHLVGVDGRRRFSLNSPERAVWWFGRQSGVSARLAWFATPADATFDRAETA
ncbi:hypothetical protein [Streptomyces sp. H27-D2]|uniref:hypothetical protein n=1 Tax=Streptomyces sp. H27-D2 TaxID=3046304 RepID=UPI002DBB30F4|nr:hypothetical protein [Streptomyces sp. H27-D2]MEC4019984.1 hypothetical protein [Streptomyces sp. H27-D2]